MPEPAVTVGVDLRQALHAIPAEVRARLAHLVGGNRVVPRLTRRVRHHDRRDHTDVVAAIAVEERDPLDAGALAGELVEQMLPRDLRQDEQHLGLRSGAARGSRRAG